MGFVYVKVGNFQKAKEIFETLFTDNNAHKAIGHRHMALLNMYLGKYSEAADHLKDSVLLYKSLNWWLSELRNRLFLLTIYHSTENISALNNEIKAVEELYYGKDINPLWLIYKKI